MGQPSTATGLSNATNDVRSVCTMSVTYQRQKKSAILAVSFGLCIEFLLPMLNFSQGLAADHLTNQITPIGVVDLETVSMLLIIMLAFIAGAFLGYYLLRSGILGHARIVELEQALAATETELADYKQRVTEEFTDTAEKFRALNRSYEDLHRQLAKSANALCGEAGVPTLLDYAATPALQEPSADPIDPDTTAVGVVSDQAQAPLESKTTAPLASSETESEHSDAALESAEAAASATALQDSTRPLDRP